MGQTTRGAHGKATDVQSEDVNDILVPDDGIAVLL